MPISAWPQADQDALALAFKEGDFLTKPAKAVRMAPGTRTSMANAYARWLVWVTETHPECLDQSPAARATRAHVLDYLHALKPQIELQTIRGYAARLRVALCIIAPHEDWDWFDPIISEIDFHVNRQPRKPKPFVESGLLEEYGIALMHAAEADHDVGVVKRAEAFRDGLAFAFLATRPLRRANMIGLKLGENVHESGESFRIVVHAGQYKTRTEQEFPLPEKLVPYMRHYLTEHRPVLAAGPYAVADERHLWLASSGAPLPSDTFADMISLHTLRHFGKRMTPHDFRHCAATTITMANPEEFMIIKVILGHASHRTAERHYDHAKGIHAVMGFQEVMMARRAAIHPAVRRAA